MSFFTINALNVHLVQPIYPKLTIMKEVKSFIAKNVLKKPEQDLFHNPRHYLIYRLLIVKINNFNLPLMLIPGKLT